jgi:MOSC domain-containing protein YiiM
MGVVEGSPDLGTADAAALRALTRCVAEVLHVGPAELPVLPEARPLDALGEWLAGRNLDAVPVSDPDSYQRPGAWIGLCGTDRAPIGWRPVVLFGVPPALILDPLAPEWGPASKPILRGLVLAQLDTRTGWRRAAPTGTGSVEMLVLAPAAGAPVVTVEAVEATPDGLAGDRYAAGTGTFSKEGRTGQAITLVEAEAIEELSTAFGAGFPAEEARRNVVTRGIDLDALIGRRFRIGEVECLGQRRCEPCAHLQRLTRDGVLRGLVHRGGLRADIVGRGTLAVGDPVVAL